MTTRALRIARASMRRRGRRVSVGQSSTHERARETVRAAFVDVFGRAPNPGELQAAQLIGWLETNYGRGWSDDPEKCPFGGCSGSNNWGAIIVRACPGPDIVPDCPAGSFLHRDNFPDGRACWQCFRAYASPEDGARHLVEVLYRQHGRETVRAAAAKGDLEGVAAAMYDTNYFTGFGSTREQRIAGQVRRMTRELPDVASGERLALNGAGAAGGARPAVGLGALAGLAAVMLLIAGVA